tara:strand:- start:637 stop:1188 length:552 start_codon:yes stop_codon:yes gene_type:complete
MNIIGDINLDCKIIDGTVTFLREADEKDFLFIDSLRKKEGKALGFIPRAVYDSILQKERVGNRDRYKYSEIIKTVDNLDNTGFCYYTYSGNDLKIQQIVIQNDARRVNRALMMLDHVEKRAKELGKTHVTARVAIDLESNMFWAGCGYSIINQMTSSFLNRKESKSKRQLHYYSKAINSLFAN